MQPVDVLIPYGGPVDRWRAQALGYVGGWYARHHPEWRVIVGRCEEPWSKGAALADAYRQATADLLVLADADSFVDPAALEGACLAALETGWAMPHRFVYRQSQEHTERIYLGWAASLEPVHLDRPMYRGVKAGGILAITRRAYDTVGGIDPRFEGWGGEDRSLELALNTLVGRVPFGPAPFFHLWHPHPAPSLRGSPEAEALVMRYREVNGNRRAMAALIEEHRCLI